jgi:hypothetical protein
MASIHNLPAEIIWEIFDKNPKTGLKLARTNKWFNEVLKDKINKYRQLIRECNSASVCYSSSFRDILTKEYNKARRHNSIVTSSYICYFHCVNCFESFEYGFFTIYFLVRTMTEINETGIVLCKKCTLKYHGERIDEKILVRKYVIYNKIEYYSDDSSDDSDDDNDDDDDN